MAKFVEFKVEGIAQLATASEALLVKANEAMRLAAWEIAGVLEAYAKDNHPWQVRTGMTKATTKGSAEQLEPLIWQVVLSAGMEYDVFLELCRQGKWAWLWPAVMANQDQIRGILAKHMGH